MGQTIKPVSSVSVCVSACGHTVAFLDRFLNVRTPKRKNEFVGVNI